MELIEGSDFEVDYSFGSLTIMNESYLAPGQEIEVEYESNQFSIIGQKTLRDYERNTVLMMISNLAVHFSN